MTFVRMNKVDDFFFVFLFTCFFLLLFYSSMLNAFTRFADLHYLASVSLTTDLQKELKHFSEYFENPLVIFPPPKKPSWVTSFLLKNIFLRKIYIFCIVIY